MKTVELFTAYRYDCDECGIENFIRGIKVELTDDEKEELETIKKEENSDGEFVTIPSVVTCRYCNATFKTIE